MQRARSMQAVRSVAAAPQSFAREMVMRGGGKGRARGWRGIVGLTLALGAVATPAAAQLSVQGWGRPLLAVPLGDFAGREEGVEAGTSRGFDLGGAVGFGPLRIYGEYQQVDFACGECGEAALEERVLDRGWGAGAIIPLVAERRRVDPWLRLGVIGHHLRFRGGGEASYSDAALGWAGGAGARVEPLPHLAIEPSLLVRRYQTRFRFSIDVPDQEISVTYLAVGLAFSLALP